MPPARHTDQCQSISQNFSLKNPAKKKCAMDVWVFNAYVYVCMGGGGLLAFSVNSES